MSKEFIGKTLVKEYFVNVEGLEKEVYKDMLDDFDEDYFVYSLCDKYSSVSLETVKDTIISAVNNLDIKAHILHCLGEEAGVNILTCYQHMNVVRLEGSEANINKFVRLLSHSNISDKVRLASSMQYSNKNYEVVIEYATKDYCWIKGNPVYPYEAINLDLVL